MESPTDSTSNAQNNEQILNDIQNLQQFEQELFNTLETNTSLSVTEQQKLIDKINDLSNFRITLYQTLGGINGFFNNALSSSLGTLKEQTVAIGIVESELNNAKKRLEILEEERNNKIRLVEINEYYGDKYEEHAKLMKIIIFTLIPIIILSIMYNKGILPDMIYRFLIIVISIIGAVYLWRRYASRIKVLMRVLVFFRTFKYVFKKPDVLCAANPTLYNTLIRDFTGSGIPCISLVDTTTNVRHITYPIPSNDDSIVLVLFFFKIFCISNSTPNPFYS